jgi:hypothetical protein
MTKRLFPKCFKSNVHAVSFHDFVSDKYPHLKSHDAFLRLCKQYTSLLCGIHFLNSGGDLEKLKRRFQRFTLLHNYPECTWELLLTTYRRSLTLYSKTLWEEMDDAGRNLCETLQQKLETGMFDFFHSVLTP